MKTVFHPAKTRGHADHGWLDTSHTFSFAGYYNPSRMNFGALRVLNDDFVAGGKGFSRHPHDNMEIISIPLSGALEHQDSMGHKQQIRSGEVQVMSAGSGLQHSEYNGSPVEKVNFLQLWIFPHTENVKPRYEQRLFEPAGRLNRFQLIVAPMGSREDALQIHQNAWLSLADLKAGAGLEYKLHSPVNGVYLFLISGELTANDQKLGRRDGAGFWETDQIGLKAGSDSELLLIEVPMQF